MNKKEYIFSLAVAVSQRSNCVKRKVGALFVNDDWEVLATGYNNPPSGFPHCDNATCLDEAGKCTKTTHAEQNGIVQAAKNGVALRGTTLVITDFPCYDCLKLLINLKIKKIIYSIESAGLFSIYAKSTIEIERYG